MKKQFFNHSVKEPRIKEETPDAQCLLTLVFWYPETPASRARRAASSPPCPGPLRGPVVTREEEGWDGRRELGRDGEELELELGMGLGREHDRKGV